MSASFGEELKRIRESRGMTVNQLAMYSGISAATLSRIENGIRGIPKPPNIKRIAEALKLPYEDLMRLAGYLPDEKTEAPQELSQAATEAIIADIVKKYGIDLTVPGQRQRLEDVVKLIFDHDRKKNQDD